jgi:hypothetical protein
MSMRRRKVILTAGLLLGGGGAARAQEVIAPPQSASPYHVRPPGDPHAGTPAPAGPEARLPAPEAIGLAPVAPIPAAAACPVATRSEAARAPEGGRWKAKVQGKFVDRPGRLDIPPLGYSVAAPYRTQVANAAAARMTLYDYDFVNGSNQLNYRGKDRLRQIAALLPSHPFPVVIERLPFAPELAEARRLTVLNELGAVAPLPPEQVVVGPPAAVPLRGVEAEAIYLNLLSSVLSRGVWVNEDLQTGGRPQAGAVYGGIAGGGGAGLGAGAVGAGGAGPGLVPR